jgi:nicotinate-nucleotide adenylyltransferase
MHKDFCYDKATEIIRHKSGKDLIFLKETYLDISSTDIRSMLGNGQSIRHLVAPAVASYIQEHGLYQTR